MDPYRNHTMVHVYVIQLQLEANKKIEYDNPLIPKQKKRRKTSIFKLVGVYHSPCTWTAKQLEITGHHTPK